jgi:xanthine dehydrogenase accessory factor
MYGNEREVLERLAQWLHDGHRAVLLTVLSTFGGSPRPPGSMAAIRDDGIIWGSVSGGCVEDDLVAEMRDGKMFSGGRVIVRTFGEGAEEQARYRLPCGNTLRIAIETRLDPALLSMTIRALKDRRVVRRTVSLEDGGCLLSESGNGPVFDEDEKSFSHLLGPRYRALLIGATELARYLANILSTLGFAVSVCDPRPEYADSWDLPDIPLSRDMPDDHVVAMNCDARSVVLAVSHDPKLDDLALMEALRTPGFYVGALGSVQTTEKRKSRLAQFDLSPEQIERLHGPVGMPIGSRTPAEIAVSVAADLVAARRKLERDSGERDAG